jgi:DNA replication protein DnaC
LEEYLTNKQYQFIFDKVQTFVEPFKGTNNYWDLHQDELYQRFVTTLTGQEVSQYHPMIEKALEEHLSSMRFQYISEQVKALAESRAVESSKWKDGNEVNDDSEVKQHPNDKLWDDKLYEEILNALAEQETVLGNHPLFCTWVKKALGGYLRQELRMMEDTNKLVKSSNESLLPVFMDCFDDEKDSETEVVPHILHPLKYSTKHQTRGKMVEEWAIAAHKTTKRIMLRPCTRKIAEILHTSKNAKRIVVTGRQGVGKTATLAAIVASARTSGWIVLYLPDGDRLRKNGYYVEPNDRRLGIFDLPTLSQEICSSLLLSHETDLEAFHATKEDLDGFFTPGQLNKVMTKEGTDTMSLVDILKAGVDKASYAPMCYAVTVDVLMKQ